MSKPHAFEKPVHPTDAMEENYYAEHIKVYPAAVSGKFRNLKWLILTIWFGFLILLPFVRWHRGEGLPDQAVLLDMAGRRFYFFFIEIWPQEVYYLTGLLIMAALSLFLITAVAGRVWCGYLCWQTVWTDLFLLVERLIEGDRRERIKFDEGPWGANKIARKVLKWVAWLGVAVATGGSLVLYFGDAPTIVRQVFTGTATSTVYMWIGILTFTTYFFAGYMREQVCIYACPWPRIQAALTDEYALNVTYRVDRGEPRASVKHGRKMAEAGQAVGDCIDCYQCVAVCPTGTDIRQGSQLSCIQCALCVDACADVMGRLGRPKGLIAYDTPLNFDRRKAGLAPIFKPIRARTVLYMVVLTLVASVMVYTFLGRTFEGVNVLHDRNPQYVVNSDGSVRNGYTVRLLNRSGIAREMVLSLDKAPAGTRLDAVGIEGEVDGNPVIPIGPDRTREVRVTVAVPAEAVAGASSDVVFRITDKATGKTSTARDFFKAP